MSKDANEDMTEFAINNIFKRYDLNNSETL